MSLIIIYQSGYLTGDSKKQESFYQMINPFKDWIRGFGNSMPLKLPKDNNGRYIVIAAYGFVMEPEVEAAVSNCFKMVGIHNLNHSESCCMLRDKLIQRTVVELEKLKVKVQPQVLS